MKETLYSKHLQMGLVVLFSFLLNASFAQLYPVQATTIITPPYSVFLADYVSAEINNLQLLLYLREINRAEYKVKLRLKIEGPSIRIATKPSYLPPPIVISGGMTTTLSGFDIRGYFHPDNLDFHGLSKQDFVRTGKLPEGFYSITIEVLDYGRSSLVSNISTASAWMILNDPPFINLPFNHEKVIATEPQNIMFSWTPRHTGSPNAAFNTEYEFTLFEINPPDRNPDDAVRSSNPIFSARTSLTSLQFGMTEPMLVPGRKYAFGIRAIDVSGRDLFKNNGFSQTHVFQYGDVCVPPKEVSGEALDMQRIKITWKEDPIHTGYRLKFREKNSGTWWEEHVNVNYLIIPELKANMEYEYQVKAVCGTIHGVFSPLGIVKTPEVTEEPFQCHVEPLPFELVPTELSRPLRVNDHIKMTDLDIRVTEITQNQNGVYMALGTAQIPMFNLAQVRLKLINIRVNDQMRVISGRYVTIYNPRSKFARTIDLSGNRDSVSTLNTSTADDIFSGVDISVTGDIEIVSADSSSSNIAVTLANQTIQHIARPLLPTHQYQEVRLTDANGDRWIVDRNGRVRQSPSVPVPPNVLTDRSEIDFTVNFIENGNHNAGLDNRDGSGLGEYDTAHIRGTVYHIPWKAVESGKTDYVNARATDKPVFPSMVGFKTESTLIGTLPSSALSDKTVNVEGHYEGTEPANAYVLLKEPGQNDTTEVDVGKLNIVTYRRVERVVHLVPVNMTASPNGLAVAAELNRIYGQAVAGWTVVIENNFTIAESYITDIDKAESGTFASYNQKMRAFNRAYKDIHEVDPNHFYFFLIKGSNSMRKGFIPFKRGLGYIFVDRPGNNVAHTLAHELGHGAFNLKHTFSEFPTIARESTENLMDYKGGSELKKYQWDHIHNPQSMIGWLQDDDESAMKSLLTSEYVFMHDQLSTRAYASTVGVSDEFTQAGVDYVDSKLYQLDTAGMKTFIYFAYIWFHAGNIDRFDQLVNNSFNHAIDSIKRHLNISEFNLLAIVNAKYDTALANGLKTVSFREQFFPISGLSQNCTKLVSDYLKSGYKKTFVSGLDAALKERADILLQYLKNCEIVIPEEIVIHYKRKGRNQYRTWGEFTIVGTDYKGYVLERPKGDNPTKLEDCKRHPGGTYDIVYSTSATGAEEKFWNVTMCLKEHNAYKLHGGTRADNSDGCFLINYNSPQFDKYPEAFQAKEQDICIQPSSKRASNPDKNKYAIANTYYQHYDENNPAYKLKQYIETMEAKIKEKYQVEQVIKKIIIDEQDEKNDL